MNFSSEPRRHTTDWARGRAAETEHQLVEALRDQGAGEGPVRVSLSSMASATGLSRDGAASGLRRLAADGRIEVSDPIINRGWMMRLVDTDREPLAAVRRAAASAALLAPGRPPQPSRALLVAMLPENGPPVYLATRDIAKRAGLKTQRARRGLKTHADNGFVESLWIGSGSGRAGMHRLTSEGVAEAKKS